MRVELLDLPGVRLEPADRHQDERGSFEKIFDGAQDRALNATQVCMSVNRVRGTVRGLHVQVAPSLEHKALWCSSGELFDVLVDTRPGEATYGDWAAVHLTSSRPTMLRIPPGIAHGYQTLADTTTVNYLIEGDFAPESARTLRWDDPTVGITWPLEVSLMSASDREGRSWPVS